MWKVRIIYLRELQKRIHTDLLDTMDTWENADHAWYSNDYYSLISDIGSQLFLTRLKIRMFTFTQGLRCPSPSTPSSGLRRVTILLSHLKTRCGDETSVGNAPNSGTKKIRTVPSSQPAASRPKRARPAWLLLWPPEGHHCRLRTRPKSCAIPSEKTGKSVDVGLFLKVQNWISELSRSETDFFEGLM